MNAALRTKVNNIDSRIHTNTRYIQVPCVLHCWERMWNDGCAIRRFVECRDVEARELFLVPQDVLPMSRARRGTLPKTVLARGALGCRGQGRELLDTVERPVGIDTADHVFTTVLVPFTGACRNQKSDHRHELFAGNQARESPLEFVSTQRRRL